MMYKEQQSWSTPASHRNNNYDVDAIRAFYQSRPMSISELAKKFGICNPTARKAIDGLPIYPKTMIYNPTLDEGYFSTIDTEVKAYYLGLIISDGNVFRFDTEKSKGRLKPNGFHTHRGMVSITLDDNDRYLLESFRNELKMTRKVTQDGRGASTVSVLSEKIADDLERLGVVPRKSFITRFPFEIDPKMYRHVIRGVFDGDGSIQANFHRDNDGRTRFKHYMTICGSRRLMSEINDILIKCNVPKTVAGVYDYKDRTLSEFRYKNIVDMYRFGSWIYEGATIYMHRKHDKFELFKDTYGITDGTTYSVNSKVYEFPKDGFVEYKND